VSKQKLTRVTQRYHSIANLLLQKAPLQEVYPLILQGAAGSMLHCTLHTTQAKAVEASDTMTAPVHRACVDVVYATEHKLSPSDSLVVPQQHCITLHYITCSTQNKSGNPIQEPTP
jgi:hypothetical protein